ncbi:unnamed protein product, partial [Sphenostylis stenocarpa]
MYGLRELKLGGSMLLCQETTVITIIFVALVDSPVCQCLSQFKPKSAENWDMMDWTQGCVRNQELSCKDKSEYGFLKHTGLKYPDITHAWVNEIFWRSLGSVNSNGNFRVSENLDLPFFDLSSMVKAANGFSTNKMLGEGGFGTKYRGILEDGQEIVVKRLSQGSGQGLNEFRNEVRLIAKLQHRNLGKLLGWCTQGEEKMPIYEYMPNNSLDSIF